MNRKLVTVIFLVFLMPWFAGQASAYSILNFDYTEETSLYCGSEHANIVSEGNGVYTFIADQENWYDLEGTVSGHYNFSVKDFTGTYIEAGFYGKFNGSITGYGWLNQGDYVFGSEAPFMGPGDISVSGDYTFTAYTGTGFYVLPGESRTITLGVETQAWLIDPGPPGPSVPLPTSVWLLGSGLLGLGGLGYSQRKKS